MGSLQVCTFLHEIVQILGETKAEERARAAGATRRVVLDASEFIHNDVASRDWRLVARRCGEPDYQRCDVWLARKARLQNIANKTHRKARHRGKDDEVACVSLYRSCRHYEAIPRLRFVPKRHAIDGTVHDARLCSAIRPRCKRWLAMRLVFVSRGLFSHREKISAVTRN